jgi:hypothetical protein
VSTVGLSASFLEAINFLWKSVGCNVVEPRSNTRPSAVNGGTLRRGVVGASSRMFISTTCFFCGGSFSCNMGPCSLDLFPMLCVRDRCGELVAFGMLANGARGRLVDMVKGSCGEGGMNTAAAIHNDVLSDRGRDKGICSSMAGVEGDTARDDNTSNCAHWECQMSSMVVWKLAEIVIHEVNGHNWQDKALEEWSGKLDLDTQSRGSCFDSSWLAWAKRQARLGALLQSCCRPQQELLTSYSASTFLAEDITFISPHNKDS